jgi:hypothetical protein
VSDEDFGSGAGDAIREIVVFGYPEARIAELLGVLRSLNRVFERLRRCTALRNRCKIDNR